MTLCGRPIGKVLLCLAALNAACGGADGSGRGSSLEELPAITLVEELRVGSVDDPEIGFSSIAGGLVDTTGRIYVFDNRDRRIRVLDAEGRALHRIGRPGEGPGEFSSRVAQPLLFGIIGDTLWVNDQGAARLTRFSLDGAVLSTERLESIVLEVAPGVALSQRPAVPLGGGQFSSSYSIGGGSMSAIVSSPAPIMAPLLLMRSDGAIIDTLAFEALRGSSPEGLQILGQRLPIPQAPDDRPLHVIDGRGVLSVTRAIAATPDGVVMLTRIGVEGDTLMHVPLRYTPKPWSAESIDLLMAGPLRIWSNRVGADADTSLAAAALREALNLPPYQPPVSAVRFAADDVIWLERETDPTLPREVALVGPDGTARGIITLPANVEVLWSHGTAVWASWTDDLDVPWLVRYRLSQ